MSMPAMCANSTPVRWGEVPTPGEENVVWPGLALAAAIISSTDCHGEAFGTANMFGYVPTSVTGARSASGS